MQHGEGSGGDAPDLSVLLALKEAEAGSLRQQIAHLVEELRRNVALNSEFRDQAAQLDAQLAHAAMRAGDAERRLAEGEAQREADAAALRAAAQEAEHRTAAQVLRARQEVADDAERRVTQLQARLALAAEAEAQLRAEAEAAQSMAALRGAELEDAARQLAAALEAADRREEAHRQVLAARDARVAELKERLAAAAAEGQGAAGAHEEQLVQLVNALGQLKETCSGQAEELRLCAEEGRQLRAERHAHKAAAREARAQAEQLRVERKVMESALQQGLTTQAAAQAGLATLRAGAAEFIAQLEEGCREAESQSARLAGRLTEERGRLVDAACRATLSAVRRGGCQAGLLNALEADPSKTQEELLQAQGRAACAREALELARAALLPALPELAAGCGPSLGAPRQGSPGRQARPNENTRAASPRRGLAAPGSPRAPPSPARPGALASVVSELCMGVTALQGQLRASRARAPNRPPSASGTAASEAEAPVVPLGALHGCSPGALAADRRGCAAPAQALCEAFHLDARRRRSRLRQADMASKEGESCGGSAITRRGSYKPHSCSSRSGSGSGSSSDGSSTTDKRAPWRGTSRSAELTAALPSGARQRAGPGGAVRLGPVREAQLLDSLLSDRGALRAATTAAGRCPSDAPRAAARRTDTQAQGAAADAARVASQVRHLLKVAPAAAAALMERYCAQGSG